MATRTIAASGAVEREVDERRPRVEGEQAREADGRHGDEDERDGEDR